MATKSKKERKITVLLPVDLLDRALESSSGNITRAVRKGLELLAASQAYTELKLLKGRVPTSLNVAELRDDRRW